MTETRTAEPGDEAPAENPAAATPEPSQPAVFSPSAPQHPAGSTASITARLEVASDGSATLVEARVSVAHPYGARSAVAHVDLPDAAKGALHDAMLAALQSVELDVRERAEEAALTHRIRARELGEDFHAEPKYVGPEITADEQIYSDAGLMALPKGERRAAIEAGVRTATGGKQ